MIRLDCIHFIDDTRSADILAVVHTEKIHVCVHVPEYINMSIYIYMQNLWYWLPVPVCLYKKTHTAVSVT